MAANRALQGMAVFIGSVSSLGNKGQIAYAVTKAGLEGGRRALMIGGSFSWRPLRHYPSGLHGHSMVRALGEESPGTHHSPDPASRLIQPRKSPMHLLHDLHAAVSGSLWADAVGTRRPDARSLGARAHLQSAAGFINFSKARTISSMSARVAEEDAWFEPIACSRQ